MANVKVSANLSEEIIEDMKRRAAQQGITMTELLRQALATQKYLEEEQDRGARIIVEHPDEERQVLTPNRYHVKK